MTTPAYEAFVAARLADGDDPNAIEVEITDALRVVATDWVQWGDGDWREDRVCPVCGTPYAGVCGHSGMYQGETILRRDFVPGKYGDPDNVRCDGCYRTGPKAEMQLADYPQRCARCRAGCGSMYVPLEREVSA